MHRRKIGFVEGQQQGVLVHVQQVLVGSHQSSKRLVSSASDFFELAAINSCHAAPEMLRFFLRRELAGQLAGFGGQTAAGSFFRVVELLSRGALRLFHNKLNFPFPEGVVNESVNMNPLTFVEHLTLNWSPTTPYNSILNPPSFCKRVS